MRLELFTFTISHFSEKARWGLDHAGVPYRERLLVPGPHLRVIRKMAPKSTVPVLRHGETCIQGSGAILDYAEQNLGVSWVALSPGDAARAKELEAKADVAFGRGTQTIFYEILLKHPKLVVDMWSQRGPFWAPLMLRLAFPRVRPLVARLYDTRPEHVAESRDRFRALFDETDRMLADGDYFFADAPHRADFAVAALLAPLCTPSEHVLRWPAFPEEALPFVAEFRDRPTWNFVRRMYREHRRPRASSSAA
ncbi:MAG: glutathione S-transferase [Polyangiales bacterium]|nr:glutathione S-transferase [Myxococcales bacterium]